LLTVARYIKGFERLEPDEMKVTSPVLRKERASNRSFLFGRPPKENASFGSKLTDWVHPMFSHSYN
jgi:hypothetical protein